MYISIIHIKFTCTLKKYRNEKKHKSRVRDTFYKSNGHYSLSLYYYMLCVYYIMRDRTTPRLN